MKKMLSAIGKAIANSVNGFASRPHFALIGFLERLGIFAIVIWLFEIGVRIILAAPKLRYFFVPTFMLYIGIIVIARDYLEWRKATRYERALAAQMKREWKAAVDGIISKFDDKEINEEELFALIRAKSGQIDRDMHAAWESFVKKQIKRRCGRKFRNRNAYKKMVQRREKL